MMKKTLSIFMVLALLATPAFAGGLIIDWSYSEVTIDYPGIGDVEEDVVYKNGTLTGGFVVPGVAFVNANTTYGYSGEFTGILEGCDVENLMGGGF